MAKRVGFRRFASSIQYHGGPFLGIPYLGEKQENCILADGTDRRGFLSIEGRLRQVFGTIFGEQAFDNIQFSSRTDRGVHAFMNTMHFDVSDQLSIANSSSIAQVINHQLAKTNPCKNKGELHALRPRARKDSSVANELRILQVVPAPMDMPNPKGRDYGQPTTTDWNARYSATERTYVYRILQNRKHPEDAISFEWDRAWCIYDPRPFDCRSMQSASDILIGTHDFSSFRAARCQRSSPIVTVSDITVSSQQYSLLGLPGNDSDSLITIKIRANSFLYRQVRNIVACLVAVGRGRMSVADVRDLLHAKTGSGFPGRAPAHGLYLAHVKHRGIVF